MQRKQRRVARGCGVIGGGEDTGQLARARAQVPTPFAGENNLLEDSIVKTIESSKRLFSFFD